MTKIALATRTTRILLAINLLAAFGGGNPLSTLNAIAAGVLIGMEIADFAARHGAR